MDSTEEQEAIVWSHRWEIHPAPPGVRTWLVREDGQMEAMTAAFLAFQVREGSCRAYGAVRRFGGSPRGELRFSEPPADFVAQTAGEQSLPSQEIFAFLPDAVAEPEVMPWFRVGRNVFFQEEEARRVSRERRELAGRAAKAAVAGEGDNPD